MKTLGIKLLATSGLAAAVGALLWTSLPAPATAFSTIGGSLGLNQRDFRVFNNFTDAQANNNTTPHPNFPGALGAIMSIWKGHAEWASGLWAGNGAGDPTNGNPTLGNGGANFDNTYQGETFAVGAPNTNVHSEIAQTNFAALAFAETPISDGWRVRYYRDPWSWRDGPGNPGSGSDIQGVATHEIGHTFGLGHEGGCATMNGCFGTCSAQRSICQDDINGIQFIYGAKAASKPTITGLTGSKNVGEVLTITGNNFDQTGNDVWFTKVSSNGVPLKVEDVPANPSGTQIDVTIPAGAVDGDLLVQRDAVGDAALSNAFPIDIGTGGLNPPFVASVDPSVGQQGGFEEIQILGLGFLGTTSVEFGDNDALGFEVISDTEILAISPPGNFLAVVDVTVTDADGTSSLPLAFQYSFNQPPDIETVAPNEGGQAGGTEVLITGPSVIGTDKIEFDGVEATDIEILSENEVTCVTPPGTAGPVDVTLTITGGVIGFTSDTITDGFTYLDIGGAFVQYGTGSGGVLDVPVFEGAGDLTPGGTGFTLDLSNAAASSPCTLFIGLTAGNVPLKGQTLLVFPLLTSIPLFTGPSGSLSLPATIPSGTPTTSIFMQYFIQDPSGVKNLTSTNGLEAQIP